MSNYEVFKKALERELPVMAHVSLFSGEQRVRLGPVANLTRTHVTIHDLGKGFRTTPLPMVRQARIQEPHKTWYGAIFEGMKQ